MKRVIFVFIFLITSLAYAVEPLPTHLINLESLQGYQIFKKGMNLNSLKLLSQFTTQQTPTYCGIASAVMILNAMNKESPLDAEHSPYRYFTQDNFFNEKVKKIISPEQVKKSGLTLKKLSEVLGAHDLKVKAYYANEVNLNKFRILLKNALKQQHFIIVNFLRTALQQEGNGHHSPIAAYDDKTDRFLLLDVARYKYPSYWVKTEALWKAVHTQDGHTYRGFIVV